MLPYIIIVYFVIYFRLKYIFKKFRHDEEGIQNLCVTISFSCITVQKTMTKPANLKLPHRTNRRNNSYHFDGNNMYLYIVFILCVVLAKKMKQFFCCIQIDILSRTYCTANKTHDLVLMYKQQNILKLFRFKYHFFTLLHQWIRIMI